MLNGSESRSPQFNATLPASGPQFTKDCPFFERLGDAACIPYGFSLEKYVLFSCKITHSIITALDRRGEDLEVLYEKCDWPAEFLRDPSSWLEAEKMENLLRMIHEEYGRRAQGVEGFITSVGHQCKDLRSWGVLDSVLRMVQTPKDLFAQPERFLSYFVSPAPPVGEMRRGSDSASFVLPVSEMQFPQVTSYLRAALEALPTYINKPMANVTWDNSRVTISWSENQTSLFGEAQNTELSLHPELVRSILINLESSQKELEDMKRTLIAKDEEIEALKKSMSESVPMVPPLATPNLSLAAMELTQDVTARDGVFLQRLDQTLSHLYRLGDYMARGQQLVTLLVGQGRQTPQVQEAMRRVDWPFVSTEGPQLVKRAVGELQEIQQAVRESDFIAAREPQVSLDPDLDVIPASMKRKPRADKMRANRSTFTPSSSPSGLQTGLPLS